MVILGWWESEKSIDFTGIFDVLGIEILMGEMQFLMCFYLIIIKILGEFDFCLVLLRFLIVWVVKMCDFKLSENLFWLGNTRVLSKWVPKSFLVFLVNCVKIWYNLWCGWDLVWNRWVGFLSWRLSWTHPHPGRKAAVSENVNYAPTIKHTIIVQYYGIIIEVTCFLYIFASYIWGMGQGVFWYAAVKWVRHGIDPLI